MSHSLKNVIAIVTLMLLAAACGGGTPTSAPSNATAAIQPPSAQPSVATQPSTVGTVVISGAGDIAANVNDYKQLLGGVDNGGEPGAKGSGFRTLTWDTVPDEQSAPNLYPPDFLNAPTAPQARGAVLSTPGTGLMVSADSDNPTGTPPRFGNINPQYTTIFTTFSPERMFSPVGSNIADLTFFVPGTNTPAVVRGFGAVYADVDTDHTAFEYFDANDQSLGKFSTPIADNGLSFLGVAFPTAVVHRVRITYGTVALGPDDSPENDVAVMDDFIYGEPQAIPGAAASTLAPAAPTSVPPAAADFAQLGQALNRDKTAAATDQQMTIGSLQAGNPGVAWATWAEAQGNTQQIFVSRQSGDQFEAVAASLNIHSNVVAEHPGIDFAGPDRSVPWVAWYEPSPGFNNQDQVFASRFNAASQLWTPAGQDRGSNEPSLNIHTNKSATDPSLVGGTVDPTKNPAPWVCWQEDSAHHNTVAIFVSHAVSDTTALGGFRWQPVGLNRGGTAQDPEPNLNVDPEHTDGEHCSIVFAETNNAVPWVVWAERSGSEPARIFVARAVADATALGGFKWQNVPGCAGPQDAAKCALNVNPIQEAIDPFMTAGTVIAGQASVPWIVWTEVGATGKHQVFVDRLDQVSRSAFLNVGGSLNVDPNADTEGPSITFVGNVPYVAWAEEVGGIKRVFVRHLASDPQTGTWVLDTPKTGLAIDKTKNAFYPIIRANGDGKIVIIWREGDPTKEASQIVIEQR